ncbi:MAG: GNAT family N-acetyltransferase [Candidatus Nanopelagicales bacterium]
MRQATVQVRPARSEDRDGVWPLVEQFAVSFAPERGAFDAAYRSLTTSRDSYVAVAETSDAVVVGYVLVHRHQTLFANGPVAWVEELFVSPDHRQQGVGRSLMDEAERWAREQEARYLALATRRAAGFYTALGYDESATFFRKLLDRAETTDRDGGDVSRRGEG